MNENINLCEILKDCPKGTKFYSPIFGDVEFETLSFSKTGEGISPKYVVVKNKQGSYWYFNPDGHLIIGGIYTHEIMLFPSEDCRDWGKWKCSKPKKSKEPKFDPKTLKPFDKILVRDAYTHVWSCDFFSYSNGTDYFTISLAYFNQTVPYNDETKHLVGKTYEAPEYYKYWED